MNSIKDRLITLSKQFKSERKFAEFLGVANTTLNQYLNGRAPTVEFCITICERMNINLTWLLIGNDYMLANPSISSDSAFSQQEFDLIQIFKQLSDNDKETLIKLAKGLLN